MISDDMDNVFRALGSPVRRRILDNLHARPGATVGEVAGAFAISRIAVMRHLAILEEADLVRSVRMGRQRRLYLNAVPLQQIAERWTNTFSRGIAHGLSHLKSKIEANLKEEPDERSA
jgi:DNA-binding transcriptional ArsR family regulator